SNIVNRLCDLVRNNLASPLSSSAPPSQKEVEVAENLYETIKSVKSATTYRYEEETTLDVGDDPFGYSSSSEDEEEGRLVNYSESEEEDDNKRHLTNYSLEYMQEVVDYADATDRNGKRRRSWKTVHHKFKALPNQGYISRFRTYLEQHGTKRQKTNDIDEIVYQKFLNAREQALPIHDIDLQRWALKAAKEVHLDDFHASHGWVNNFKGRHHVVSRRITNVVTRHELENIDAIVKTETEFRQNFFKLSSHYSPSQILNTDQ
ncbi:unnamed protein product, partial [Didymodactylos carnosus]